VRFARRFREFRARISCAPYFVRFVLVPFVLVFRGLLFREFRGRGRVFRGVERSQRSIDHLCRRPPPRAQLADAGVAIGLVSFWLGPPEPPARRPVS
jgi:hypothetical protein